MRVGVKWIPSQAPYTLLFIINEWLDFNTLSAIYHNFGSLKGKMSVVNIFKTRELSFFFFWSKSWIHYYYFTRWKRNDVMTVINKHTNTDSLTFPGHIWTSSRVNTSFSLCPQKRVINPHGRYSINKCQTIYVSQTGRTIYQSSDTLA